MSHKSAIIGEMPMNKGFSARKKAFGVVEAASRGLVTQIKSEIRKNLAFLLVFTLFLTFSPFFEKVGFGNFWE